MLTPRTLKKPTVRRACRITGYTDQGPAPAPCELRLTRSPELQRRNGVMLLLHSGVTMSEPTSPSATGAPVLSITSRKRSEEHTSELQSRLHLVCRLLLEKKKKTDDNIT